MQQEIPSLQKGPQQVQWDPLTVCVWWGFGSFRLLGLKHQISLGGAKGFFRHGKTACFKSGNAEVFPPADSEAGWAFQIVQGYEKTGHHSWPQGDESPSSSSTANQILNFVQGRVSCQFPWIWSWVAKAYIQLDGASYSPTGCLFQSTFWGFVCAGEHDL